MSSRALVNLSYQDALELLGYASTGRHPLEILGYEYSTRGMRQFRQERPDVASQLVPLIQASLEEAGMFPREPGEEVLRDGAYLERRSDGVILFHSMAEVSVSRSVRMSISFETMKEAIGELLRRVGNSVYVAVGEAQGG
jgi:hypothetical protein